MRPPIPSTPSATRSGSDIGIRAIAAVHRPAAWLVALIFAGGIAGCSILKPAQSTGRYFVLSHLPARGTVPTATNTLAVGLGQVKIPVYLFDSSLAVRRGGNEIDYLTSILWAERLDTGIQRALAANLAVLVPTNQIRLTAWRSEDVVAEVYVTIQQFDVNSTGRSDLVAFWRIVAPGGGKTLSVGESRLTREGPSPDSDPSGAVATLSDILVDLSRQLAHALQARDGLRPPPRI